MKRSIAPRISLALLLIFHRALAQAQSPWWVTMDFEPNGSEIGGLALTQLDSSWVSATALTDNLLPDEAFPQGSSIRIRGGAFEVLGDLAGDDGVKKAIVGVYRADTGEVGRFLLVLTAEEGGNWSRHSLIKQPGRAGFSWLRSQTNRLEWWFCFDCDHMCTVDVTAAGSECRFPHIGPEGPCTVLATESGLECRYPEGYLDIWHMDRWLRVETRDGMQGVFIDGQFVVLEMQNNRWRVL